MADDVDPVSNIIEKVAQDVVNEDRRDKIRQGIDLAAYKPQLRTLLRDAYEIYLTALDDWQARNDPDKPEERLEDNWDEDEQSPPDYRDNAGAGLDDWDIYWKHFYYRGPGRKHDLPVEPLHPVFLHVRNWWRKTLDTPFSVNYKSYPRNWDFAKSDEDHESEADDNYRPPRNQEKDMQFYSPQGRLFLLVVQELDNNYTADNVANIQDTLKKSRNRSPK